MVELTERCNFAATSPRSKTTTPPQPGYTCGPGVPGARVYLGLEHIRPRVSPPGIRDPTSTGAPYVPWTWVRPGPGEIRVPGIPGMRKYTGFEKTGASGLPGLRKQAAPGDCFPSPAGRRRAYKPRGFTVGWMVDNNPGGSETHLPRRRGVLKAWGSFPRGFPLGGHLLGN